MKNIVILHGWPQYDISNHFLTVELKKQNYNVLTPNMFINEKELTNENILEDVKTLLKGQNPHSIIGISLGGLILPSLAQQYPNTKLIYIASGVSMRSKNKVFNFLLKLATTLLGKALIPLILKLPKGILTYIYKLANPFKGDMDSRNEYERDTKENITAIKSIPTKKELEILRYIQRVDNGEVLKEIKNKSLIFSGENDSLMDIENGKTLHSLLKNSRLILTKGSHYNSFTNENVKDVLDFLREN